MRTVLKRTLSLLLALAMILSVVPATFAEQLTVNFYAKSSMQMADPENELEITADETANTADEVPAGADESSVVNEQADSTAQNISDTEISTDDKQEDEQVNEGPVSSVVESVEDTREESMTPDEKQNETEDPAPVNGPENQTESDNEQSSEESVAPVSGTEDGNTQEEDKASAADQPKEEQSTETGETAPANEPENQPDTDEMQNEDPQEPGEGVPDDSQKPVSDEIGSDTEGQDSDPENTDPIVVHFYKTEPAEYENWLGDIPVGENHQVEKYSDVWVRDGLVYQDWYFINNATGDRVPFGADTLVYSDLFVFASSSYPDPNAKQNIENDENLNQPLSDGNIEILPVTPEDKVDDVENVEDKKAADDSIMPETEAKRDVIDEKSEDAQKDSEDEYADETKGGEPLRAVGRTVTLMVDGEVYDTITVPDGGTVNDLPSPSKDGYRFDKWVTGSGSTFDTETVVTENITITAEFIPVYTLTFYSRDAKVYKTITVDAGSSIGDKLPAPISRDDYKAYWAIGRIKQGTQGPEIEVTGSRIGSSYVPESDLTIVPDYEKITYTVTFYEEDKSTVVGTPQIVDSDSNYCVNSIPAVPTKTGYSGKWVYDGGDFSNNVAVNEDTTVWAEYAQSVFYVTYLVEDETYKTEKYYSGDLLKLPTTDPVVEGKQFVGWYAGETQYTGNEPVKSDLTLTAHFNNMYSVSFIVKHDDQTEERLQQYFRNNGEAIGTMPQDPFVAGKVFEKWVDRATGTEVTAATLVNGDMIVEAQFRTIDIYNITAEYYYLNDDGQEVIFNTDLLQAEGHELPYQIDAPATTQTDPDEVSGAPIYYPETPSISVTENMFDAEKKVTVRFKYVAYTAQYDFVYKVKDLTGSGYTEIPDSREHIKGVLNSYVTPTVKTFEHYTLEIAQGATITQASGQELEVKYTRKNYQLTYDSKGGSFVSGVTVPYGTQQAVTSDEPTREGYRFAGWYTDEACTQAAGSSVTVNGNTTLYAKWTGKNVNYTIVYMFEKYNDAGTASEYVYDNSRDATAAVGSTVQASSAPSITRKGWEVDTAKNATSSVVIAADGSSVLYVYYKLTEYTFRFRPHNYYGYDVTASLNGQSRTGDNYWSYTFKAKLGQDISSVWISAGNGTYYYGYYNVNFSGWIPDGGSTVYVTKRLTLAEDMLPSSGTTITYNGYWLASTVTYTVNYMLQNADDDNYTKSEAYSQTYNYSSGASLSPKDIPGYTYVRRTDSGNTSNLYYDRDKFKIDYFYGSTKLDTIENIKFDANINKAPYVWTPTAAQCGVDSDYTFAGWYADSGLTSTYTFTTMPAANLVLYAKWNAPSYTVSFDTDGGSSIESQTVEKYKTASAPQTNPTKDGYIFDGWFTSAEGTDLFQWNTQITEDTTVYDLYCPLCG